MADGSPRLGKARKCYLDVDGDIETPTWVELGKIQGLNKSFGYNVAEIEERAEDDVLVLLSHKTREITIELTCRPGDTNFDAIQDAYEDGTKVGLAVMSGPIATAGERGYQAEVYITQFNADEAHTNTAVSITCRPAADYTTAPAFVEISS